MVHKKTAREYTRIRGDTGQHQRILATALLLGALCFIPVGVRLYWLMVTHYETYRSLALDNQTRVTPVAAQRGMIYDRNMNIMACDESVEDVYLDPRELRQAKVDISALSQDLAQLLSLDADFVQKQGEDLSKRYKRIAAGIDRQTADLVRAYISEQGISGIHLEPAGRRVYPYGTLAAQVIGFTNASNEGAEGVEASYDRYLSGSTGGVITTKGNHELDIPYSYEAFDPGKKGCSVVLTLDTTVQQCLEKQMEAAMARYAVQNGAFGMVMEVKTGKVLAMATLGSFDPNDYLKVADEQTALQLEQQRLTYLMEPMGTEGYTQGLQAYQQALREAQLKQWRNRCISDGYEPGSTFKVLTMAAALDCGAIDLETSFHCSGTQRIPGRAQLLHCWRSTGHGSEKTPQALQNSCNIAFANIALKLGGQQFYDYVQRFGILEKTGIDLAGESKGVFFDKALVTDTDKWGTASLTSGSFGQTFKLTPLQLVRAISAVVNGGYLLEPYMVCEVLDGDGNTVLKQEPTVVRRVIREETSQTMCRLLESVVTEGTAKNASVCGFSIGGKTGTSEKIDVFDENGQRVQDKIVSFVGIAPMDDPQYIVLVALDTPSRATGLYISGGVMAAPTVGAVLADILPYLGTAHSYTQADAAGRTCIVPDLEGLTAEEASAVLQELGLEYKALGQETQVTSQIPSAGQEVPGDSQLILYFGRQQDAQAVTVPDFSAMTRQQAADAAGKLGIYILVTGNPSPEPSVTVVAQSVAAGTQLQRGETIKLQFADTKAAD